MLHIKRCYMRKILLVLTLLFLYFSTSAQLLSWAPQFSTDNSTVVITADGTKGNKGLLGYTGTVYMHFGVITNLSTNATDWKYVPTTWATTTAPVATSLGGDKWSFTITNPRAYFNAGAGGVPAGETILKIAVLFRDAAGDKVQKNADGTDMYVPIYAAGGNHIQFINPLIVPTNVLSHEAVTANVNQSVTATALASATTGTLNLYFNGAKIAGPLTATATITANPTITTTGDQQIISELITGGVSYYDTINFYVTPVTVIADLPAGVKEGINYGSNCNSVTLVLFAPNKKNALLIGDFPGSNWTAQSQYQMNKTPDSNYYWLTINGLTSGTEYAFQYLVDNSIYIADPYSEKILDPNNDQYIPAATYPGLKPYPVNANVSGGKNGIVSVLQTCAPAYTWQATNFTKPDKRNLITYELLVRDFGDARNYQMLIDTIGYFKRLGINAIELMPVNEFSGNESWGYNPTFYCALDKAYGTKNKFKEFIDLCHQNNIAVILDVVYNHLDAFSTPQGKLYWDAAAGKPAANSPWFNQTAPHPYSVFEDLNHTATATQYLVERSMEYWLGEYKIDGFRFDLAKGFTQTATTTTTVENYDASRVANLNRYYDYIIPKYPDTYMILEFLGQQRQEEQEYATKGFMLWGNNNPSYNQNTMGYNSNADISKIIYNSPQQGFTTPVEMGYMESHDEERLMYKNLQYGNTSGSYNVKNLATALERQAAAAAIFFTIPGPKMIWQFGERGYDIPLDFNGSNVANKPPHWEYMSDANRLKLWDAYSKLIRLRLNNSAVFNNTTFSYDFNDNNGLFRRFQIADPAAGGTKVTVVANMDVVPQTRSITFQATGDWYNYLSSGTTAGINGATDVTFNITAAAQSITLQPGEYHVYLSKPGCTTALPTATAAINYCQNETASALGATGTNILWYITAAGGTGSATAPIPLTSVTGTTTYYVSQTIGCESARLPIVVTVTAATPAPAITTPVTYCQNSNAVALTATGTNLLWYNASTGGTGSAAAPLPATNSAGSTIYYVSQTLSCGEGPRAAITVTVSSAPAAPAGLTVSAITLTSATLNWNAVPGIFYSVDYKTATVSAWINAATGITTNSFSLQNLTAATVYDWRVSANCSAVTTNNYTTDQFATSSANSSITNIKNGFGIKISPDPVNGEAVIDYLLPGNGTVSIVLVSSSGQVLKTLFRGNKTYGQHQLILSNQLKAIISGNYFIRLVQNGKGHFIQFIKK
jgi:1,4-alpha-glucan branching enzyme